MYLVGVVQRTLVYIEVFACPRIAVCHRHLAVTITPIALAPIAGVVAYACMRYGCGEDVGLGLQVLGHKPAVRCTDTAHALGVYVGVDFKKRFCSFDNVFGHTLACGVDMA